MRKLLQILRWLFSLLSALILIVIIVGSAFISALSRTATDSSNIKSWLEQGEVYEQVPQVVTELIEVQQDDQDTQSEIETEEGSDESMSLDQLPFEQDQLQELIATVLPPDWLQRNMEYVIDATYVWFEGDTDIPEFEIDINDRISILASEMERLIKEELNGLPQCTSEQEATLTEEDFNPFEAECKPSFFTDDKLEDIDKEMEEEMRKELEKNDAITNGVVASDSFFEMETENIDKVHMAYAYLTKALLYVIAVIFIFTLLLFVLVPGWENKLFVIGITYILPTIVLFVSTFLGKDRLEKLYTEKLLEVENGDSIIDAVQTSINLAIDGLFSKIRFFSIILLLLGIVFVVVSVLVKKKGKKNQKSS